MPLRHILIIWAHPRTDSQTARVANAVRDELTGRGHSVAQIDLYREDFDPVLRQDDEPDWRDLGKTYSSTVMELADQARAATAVVFVFPIWWYSVPAIMKGYIDRVWNHGLFYGGGTRSGIHAARWIGLAGTTEASYTKRGYDTMMEQHLNVGIAALCGITDSAVEFLYDALDDGSVPDEERVLALTAQARRSAGELSDSLLALRADTEPPEDVSSALVRDIVA